MFQNPFHSKEHCLVGIKGNPRLNKFLDTDVLVAEVRETSRKPDEIYGMIERLSPGTRKMGNARVSYPAFSPLTFDFRDFWATAQQTPQLDYIRESGNGHGASTLE